MYLMIGKEQIAQKDHIGAKIDLRTKFMGKYKYLVILADAAPMLLQVVNCFST